MAVRHSPVEVNRARALRWQGDSIREIAVVLGIPKSTVAGWVRGLEDEAAMLRYCRWCGDAFLTNRRDRTFCCVRHCSEARRARRAVAA
jgi:hypothetical protein